MRLTVSPSTIFSQSPNSTAPTLSDSRFSARPVTSCGSSSISSDMQLSRPWMRAMPSADREHGADLGQVGAAGVEALDAALEDAGDLVGLDLHACLSAPCGYAARGDAACAVSRAGCGCSRRGSCCRPARRARRGSSGSTSLVELDAAAGLAARSRRRSARRSAWSSSTALVTVDRQAACSPRAQSSLELARGSRKITGMRCFSISSSRKFTSSGSASVDRLAQPVAASLGGEVRARRRTAAARGSRSSASANWPSCSRIDVELALLLGDLEQRRA